MHNVLEGVYSYVAKSLICTYIFSKNYFTLELVSAILRCHYRRCDSQERQTLAVVPISATSCCYSSISKSDTFRRSKVGNLKPKFHFLTHYPTILLKNDPVINFWGMRFESSCHQERSSHSVNKVSSVWKETYDQRIKVLGQKEKKVKVVSLASYFSSFPCLKYPLGIALTKKKEGVVIKISGVSLRIKFQSVVIVGDNLGLNGIFVFVECFSSKYYCRICRASSEEASRLTKEDNTKLRSKENYEEDVLLADASKTGIKKHCVFNNVTDFHILDNLSMDLMHDVLEGVCSYVAKSKLPIITLNRLLQYADLKMSVAEMLCFVRYFGVIIGDVIPKNDEH
ncbi:hypothetical protein TSAR_009738 [Trichomalopsis sarcophagae]|uniref:Uncharacterized protein n=1 Tax=Trichomalopsis sarcophagae TaxID=543379 RepID=A0A232EZ01_9HYME|nr:hypothetical protein TSAR_009738 [Trichomalopsis sarcophagae]